MTITTCIFDAYGTLFDVSSAAKRLAEQGSDEALADRWQTLAGHWRDKQLQYSWLRAVTGEFTSFWQVTQDGLDWALEATELDGNPDRRAALLDLYWNLAAYEEVRDTLAKLKEMGQNTAILSNGSRDMLAGAVGSAGLDDLLDDVLTVDDVGVFKPARVVYDMVGERFGTTPDQVCFCSSNGWDASAAMGYGFKTCWINRAGVPVDRLDHRPRVILRDLSEVPARIAEGL